MISFVVHNIQYTMVIIINFNKC